MVFPWPGGGRGSTVHLQYTWTLVIWGIMREQGLVDFQLSLLHPHIEHYLSIAEREVARKLADFHCVIN